LLLSSFFLLTILFLALVTIGLYFDISDLFVLAGGIGMLLLGMTLFLTEGLTVHDGVDITEQKVGNKTTVITEQKQFTEIHPLITNFTRLITLLSGLFITIMYYSTRKEKQREQEYV
jgi:hypothetical protein